MGRKAPKLTLALTLSLWAPRPAVPCTFTTRFDMPSYSEVGGGPYVTLVAPASAGNETLFVLGHISIEDLPPTNDSGLDFYTFTPSAVGDCSTPIGNSQFNPGSWNCTFPLSAFGAGPVFVSVSAGVKYVDGEACSDTATYGFVADKEAPQITLGADIAGKILSSTFTFPVSATDDVMLMNLGAPGSNGYQAQLPELSGPTFWWANNVGDYRPYFAGFTAGVATASLQGLRGDVELLFSAVDNSLRTTDLRVPVTVDADKPQVSISTPLTVSRAGAFRAVGGTASDDVRVKSVSVGLQDSATGKWWSGSAFDSTDPVLSDASLTPGPSVNWEYSGFNVPLATAGATWLIVAQSEDMVGRKSLLTSSVFRIEPPIYLARTPDIFTEGSDGCLENRANRSYGDMASPGRPSGLPGNSPALEIAATHHSSAPRDSVWGFGWTTIHDQTLGLRPSKGLTWNDGRGGRRNFFPPRKDAANQDVYISPLQTFSTMTVRTRLGDGTPQRVELREKDGTVLVFDRLSGTTTYILLSLTDRNGSPLTYARDPQGRLTTVTDVHNRFLNVAYGANGKVESITDSAGRVVSYTYDAEGNRASEVGPYFPADLSPYRTVSYLYDVAHRITRVTWPNGGSRSYVYDAKGRVLSETDDLGGGETAVTTYDYFPSSTVVTDPRGNKTRYDLAGLRGLKRPAALSVPSADPEGPVNTSFQYDAAMNLKKQFDERGNPTDFEYDSAGNATKVTTLLGQTDIEYDPTFGQPTRITDPRRNPTQLEYNATGDLRFVRPLIGPPTELNYDPQGHVTNVVDPNGKTSFFAYDPLGALNQVTDPMARITKMTRDAASRVTQTEDPAHKFTYFTYDAEGNLLTVRDHTGGVTTYSYEFGTQSSLLKSVMDARQRLTNQRATTFAYDKAGRLTLVTNPLGYAKSFKYDGKGNLIETRDANGNLITFQYDAQDRLTHKTITGVGTVQYGYDPAGNLTSVTHPNGTALSQGYDALNRLKFVVQTLPGGRQVRLDYDYDANGNRTSVTTSLGDTFTSSYDALNRLTSITNTEGRAFGFGYDSNGRRNRLFYPSLAIQADYLYDDAGLLLSIEHKRQSDQALIAKAAYLYEDDVNRTKMTDLKGTHSFRYDDLHRLIEAAHPPTSTIQPNVETFSHDAVGNRTADGVFTAYQYDDANRILENSAYTFTHDFNGNVTRRTAKAGPEDATLTYDPENQLTKVEFPDGSRVDLVYDALGRRVEKSVFSPTQGTMVRRYAYDREDILYIFDEQGVAIATFTHGPGIDEPLMMKNRGAEFFFIADGLGSITGLTDTAGNVLERVEYAAYGMPTFEDLRGPPAYSDRSFTDNPLAHNGRPWDPELWLYDSRARLLDPSVGRFLQSEPIPTNIALSHPYLYASANPIRKVDPFGLLDFDYVTFGECVREHRVDLWAALLASGSAFPGKKQIARALGKSGGLGEGNLTNLPSLRALLLDNSPQALATKQALRRAGDAISRVLTPVTVVEGAADYIAIGLCAQIAIQEAKCKAAK